MIKRFFLIIAAFVLGVLTAPGKGNQTRGKIGKWFTQLGKNIKTELRRK